MLRMVPPVKACARSGLGWSAAVLALTLNGCAAFGYPAPLRAPITVLASSGARSGGAGTRTYEVLGRSYTTLASSAGYLESGLASWYGEPFHGRPTASGEIYDMNAFTAAHRTLPLRTCVEVERVDDGRTVVVRVNDRGPFDDDSRRIIDLSYGSAVDLGIIGAGTAEVVVRTAPEGTTC